jgi:hypothetical protein
MLHCRYKTKKVPGIVIIHRNHNQNKNRIPVKQCFGHESKFGSAFDGFLDPDPEGGKSAQKA